MRPYILFLFFFIPIAVYSQSTVLLHPIKGEQLTEDLSFLDEKLYALIVSDSKYSVIRSNDQIERGDSLLLANQIDKTAKINLYKVNNTFLITLTQIDQNQQKTYYYEEIQGSYFDVAEYGIYNIAMEITESQKRKYKPLETVTNVKPKIKQMPKDSGNVQILVPRDSVQIFVDNISIGTADTIIRLPIGIHKVTIQMSSQRKSDLVEVYKDTLSKLSFKNKFKQKRRFFYVIDTDFSFSTGKYSQMGFHFEIGGKIFNRHYIALESHLNFSIGKHYEDLFGGGAIYAYTIYHKNSYMIDIGGTVGFWETGSDDYFGGTTVKLNIGKRIFHFNSDFTLLIGTSIKPILNTGISFIF